MTKTQMAFSTGVAKTTHAAAAVAPTVELFGHVNLVEGYALPGYHGVHALIALRDTPGKTIAVLTTQVRLQSLLETALATGNLVADFCAAPGPTANAPRRQLERGGVFHRRRHRVFIPLSRSGCRLTFAKPAARRRASATPPRATPPRPA